LPDEIPSIDHEDYALTVRPPATLPLWQRQYLGALEAGLTEHQAVAHANVSPDIVNRYAESSEVFGSARARVMAGVAVMDREELKARALCYGSVVLDDAFKESRDPEVRSGDRLGNRKFLGEAAGFIGAAGKPQVGMTLNAAQIIVLLGNES
jgi:hypothetical protein